MCKGGKIRINERRYSHWSKPERGRGSSWSRSKRCHHKLLDLQKVNVKTKETEKKDPSFTNSDDEIINI